MKNVFYAPHYVIYYHQDEIWFHSSFEIPTQSDGCFQYICTMGVSHIDLECSYLLHC